MTRNRPLGEVFYLMSGPAHCPYLAASLLTLRRWWNGPVRVYAWPESLEIARQVCLDRRVRAKVLGIYPDYRGKNDQFIDKIVRGMGQPHTSLYLDADTTVHGSVNALLEAAEGCGFCATQWNDWMTNVGMTRGRVLSLLEYPEVAALARVVADESWPSLNGGVWAARPDSPVLKQWHRGTLACSTPRHTFIADEKVLNVLQAEFVPIERMAVALGGRWNCSPKYHPAGLPDEDVVVRHYHGDSNVRPDKSRRGLELWWPTWRECLRLDTGGCRSWWRECGNRWLRKLGNAETAEEAQGAFASGREEPVTQEAEEAQAEEALP